MAGLINIFWRIDKSYLLASLDFNRVDSRIQSKISKAVF